MTYTEEQEIILPTLKLLKENTQGLTTTQIKKALINTLPLSKEDNEPSPTRKGEIKFEQIIRNLKSHDTLEKKGLATYKNGLFKITDKGLDYIEKKEPLYDSLEEQGFDQEQITKEINKDYKGLIIEEGALEKRNVTQRKRSDKLRQIAIEKFKADNDGKLPCVACDFDFEETYGDQGKGFIEIHHEEPIHEADIKGNKQEIEEALKKVYPLCSNCHRMIHRKRRDMLSVEELTKLIKKTG